MRKRGLYGQTVTVYHPVPMKKRVDRYVLHDVFCQIGSREVPDAAGAKSGAACRKRMQHDIVLIISWRQGTG